MDFGLVCNEGQFWHLLMKIRYDLQVFFRYNIYFHNYQLLILAEPYW